MLFTTGRTHRVALHALGGNGQHSPRLLAETFQSRAIFIACAPVGTG